MSILQPIIKIYLLILLSAAFLFGCQPSSKQEILLNKIEKACGTKENFLKVHFLQFTFNVEKDSQLLSSRKHLWDKFSGDYQQEYSIGKDSLLKVLFNVNSQAGTSYINGEKVLLDSLNAFYVLDAYETFINDTYWLLVPLKLKDSGVHVQLMTDTLFNEKNVNVLYLNFDNGIGITDKDEYWLFVDEVSGEILGWKYDLEGRKGKPRTYNWSQYSEIGAGIKLPLSKISADGRLKIYFSECKAWL